MFHTNENVGFTIYIYHVKNNCSTEFSTIWHIKYNIDPITIFKEYLYTIVNPGEF